MRAANRAVVALLLPWLAAACAGQTNQEFDMRLREMAGSNERSLLGGMGRIPDMWMPIGGFPPTLVRQGCIVEWTVTKGNTQSYRWQGSGCNTVTIHATAPPG